MVQTYQSPVRVYKYPFEVVMAAYEKRFPTCPMIPIFVGSETVYEYKSDDGAEHVVERKCKLNVDAPYLLKKIAGVDYVYFTQKNSLDWRNRTLAIEASNITFNTRVQVVESCQYYVHPENKDWTCFEQSANLDVKSFFGFEATVEKVAMKQYSHNIQKGKEVIEYYISEILSTGATVPRPFPLDSDSNTVASENKSVEQDSAISETTSTSGTNEREFGDVEVSDKLLVAKPPSVRRSRERSESEDKGTKKSGEMSHFRMRTGTMVKNPLAKRHSAEEADRKLETEYIHRFLGDLSPVEESRLCELRYSLMASHKGKVPNDAHLLRFLRAREFDVQGAREMIVASMMWRKQHQVDKILSTYQPPSILLQFFPGAWHHHDREGRPIFVLRLGQLDVKGLQKSVGEDNLVKFVLSICEEGLQKCEEATVNFGRPINCWTLLIDLEGLSMRHLWRPGVRAMLRIIEIAEANYPETMGLALIVRAPRVFPVLYTLIGPVIDENTRRKFLIYGGNDYTGPGGLCEYIDEKNIPDFLSGKLFCLAPEGGLVPKSLYATHANDEDDAAKGAFGERSDSGGVLESLYQKGYVYKGLPLEVLVPINESGCVLTWDFDVARGECEFVLLRSNKVMLPEQYSIPSPGGGLTSLGPSGIISAAAPMSPSRPVAFDKSLELGSDLFIETHPLVCHEGDSIQGSQYCSTTGTLILQWRHPDLSAHSSYSFDLPSLHKAKVMYYYEVLSSDHFRGSMASLESCRSSFSSLSLTTSSQQGAIGGKPTVSSPSGSFRN